MREKDKHKDGVHRSKSKRKALEGFDSFRRNNGDLIERSITPSDLYSNGGVLAGSVTAGGAAGAASKNSRPSSPVASSILKKRTSFPVAGSFANILNFSPHRRRPSLQTRSSHHSSKSNPGPTSAGPPPPASTYPHAPAAPSYSVSTIGSSRSRSGSAHSPSISSLQNTPLQTPTTSTHISSSRNLASESTTTLSSTNSSSLSSMNPSYDGGRATGSAGGGAESPTVPGYGGLESPLSTRSEGNRAKSSRLGDGGYGTARYEETWDSDPALDVEEEEEDEQDERTGTRFIPASRRIMTPQTPMREDGGGSSNGGMGSSSEAGRYNTFRRGLGITEPDLKMKSRSNSNASSRAGFGGGSATDAPGEMRNSKSVGIVTPIMGPAKVVNSKKIVEGSLDLLHTHPSISETTITRTEGEGISRPGSTSPHPEVLSKTPSSSRSARDDATSSMSSTSASLRAASLNQVVAIKRQRELAGEDVPPKSSSSNSSSEALSTISNNKSSKANRNNIINNNNGKMTLTSSRDASIAGRRHPPSLELPLPDPLAPRVEPAPASGMYWYKAFSHGIPSVALRAHTCTLIGSSIYVFGGCDSKTCFNELYVFDADSMYWSKPEVSGDIPPPLRAMTTTAVNKKLIIFGGGDGPTYYNDVYILDTVTHRYTKPKISGQIPSKRRAHTACLYKNGLYVFGGGDGVRALNDVWRLDVSDLNKMSWKQISSASGNTTIGGAAAASTRNGKNPNASQTSLVNASGGTHAPSSGKPSNPVVKLKPTARGYHTANMVQNKLIIFGGSDGVDCFKDVWVFDVETSVWKCVDISVSYPRLSHTATLIGSYLFVVGGHDGVEYSNEVLLLNLVTMQWDKRRVYGLPPSGRGYHGAALHDSRLFVIGGFDGHSVFNETFILELAISSYYSQISHFNIEV
ncbi:hypothetical protein H072_10929 [Dactylellina haptotyla CBS 200.50]|uniref:Tip elongation aberrant protein 1 n=1 Tax=Dactylellina haptotyla (strain CBS 200.50) TaxID=1284197 RepID=S7ZYZ1_DACHA|nr:hypothetical protein H072_10929 [Dactylellina haptotyla CBS 200.50]